MNNEIKEILSYLKKKENTRRIKCITIEESKQLLDYIINLQQENERLKDELETMTFTAKIKQEAVDSLITKIDKAIEYIENPRHEMSVLTYQNLLNILQNGSDDNE